MRLASQAGNDLTTAQYNTRRDNKATQGFELSPVAQLIAQPRRVKSGVMARAKVDTVGGTAATRVPGRFPRSQQETFEERPWRHIYPRRMIAQVRLLAGDKGQVLGQ